MIVIPEMTHELSRAWDQPSKSEFAIDQLSEYAIMSEDIFKRFKNYSHSQPTGAYEGKMWTLTHRGINYLRWYDTHPTKEGFLKVHELEIIII